MQDITPDEFRRVMGLFTTGVSIVTTRSGDDVHGTTMSALCSVSLTPPLVLICVDHESDIHEMIRNSSVFAVNFLNENQKGLAQSLSRKDTPELIAAHRLELLEHTPAETGAPILADHLAYIDCRVENTVEAGDHTIFVGQAVAAGLGNGDINPLLHFKGEFRSFAEST